MARYKTQFTFLQTPQNGTEIRLSNPLGGTFEFYFKTTPVGPLEVKIGYDLYETIVNMMIVFNTVYNRQGLYTVTRGANQWEFVLTASEPPTVIANTTQGSIAVGISLVQDNLAITNIEFIKSTNSQCTYVDFPQFYPQFSKQLHTSFFWKRGGKNLNMGPG